MLAQPGQTSDVSQRMACRYRARGAFTLVEVLVVISIVGVMVALLIPSLMQAREAARRVLCSSNLRGMGTMVFTYAADNRESVAINDINAYQGQWYMSGGATDFGRMLTNWGGIKKWPAPSLNCASAAPLTGSWSSLPSRYIWLANNYGSYTHIQDASASLRPFPRLGIRHLERLQEWKNRPVLLAMDIVNSNTVSVAAGNDYRTNHWRTAGNDYDGGNAVHLDGSARWYAWNGGTGWYQNNHSMPPNTTYHMYNSSGGSRIHSNNDDIFQGNQA